MSATYELNMDGLVGPTHHYAGLSPGNIASTENAFSIANPQAAALQGIEKMQLLHQLGLKQALLPPHARPNLNLLKKLGFSGPVHKQVRDAFNYDPNILSAVYSASSMWTANAATVSASQDTKDGRVHFTAANLVSNLHRSQEADFYSFLLKVIFSDETHFSHHEPLPCSDTLGDEGAANHNRLCRHHGEHGLNLFVYGKKALPANNSFPKPKHFPARQTFEASHAIARRHQLKEDHILFASQNPDVIDDGVFHNDVISVANESMLLVHELAFVEQKKLLNELNARCSFDLSIVEVPNRVISVQDAVSSYLFNSQLITLPSQGNLKKMALIAPSECQDAPNIRDFIQKTIDDNANPLSKVIYMDLKQSMRNGGGPACLRLRVPLTDEALYSMHQGVVINPGLLEKLKAWVVKHYRTELSVPDLSDPALVDESYTALEELTNILNIGSIYPFQQSV